MNVREALDTVTGLLAGLPHSSPRLEAELLLCDATGLDRIRLVTWPEAEIGKKQLTNFQALVQRRLAGEPIAYIRGRQAFWTLDLHVNSGTLIPRPETELLVELALEKLPADKSLLVLDAGCGSGAIAAALACERPAWTLIAAERSLEAIPVARENLRRLAPRNTRLVNCDWLTPFAEGSLDALIGNPPYVPEADPHLAQGDLPFEPRSALSAGTDGLDAIRILSGQSASRLRSSGLIALEHGWDQGPAVREILAQCGFEDISTHCDLSGRDRVTTGLLGSRSKGGSGRNIG